MTEDGIRGLDICLGETFKSSRTVGEALLDVAGGLIGGTHPVHVDANYARRLGLRDRALHGGLTTAIMLAGIGQRFGHAPIVIAEHSCRFRAPVHPGDILRVCWRVTQLKPASESKRGTVVVEGDCTNQADVLVAQAQATVVLLVPAPSSGPPSSLP